MSLRSVVVLRDATEDLAKLDFQNLALARENQQLVRTMSIIRAIQERIQEAATVDDLYTSTVRTLTSDLPMDCAALLDVDIKTRRVRALASKGLPRISQNIRLNRFSSGGELLKPAFVNSSSSLRPLDAHIVEAFGCPFFLWYPMTNEEGGAMVMYVGNKTEALLLKRPFSNASLETIGTIAAVVLLRRDRIVKYAYALDSEKHYM